MHRVQVMRTTSSSSILVDALPVVAAIGVFGVIYGATASTVMSPGMTMASSLLMFSGAAQFSMVGLLDAGAASPAILLAVAVLGLRHVPLAAVVLPRIQSSRPRRALLALALIDETVGLALVSRRPAGQTMALVGASAYATFAAGTLAGVLGADVLSAAPFVSVVFVILFVGLASLTCRSWSDIKRATAAGIVTAGLVLLLPEVGAFGAIVAATASAATAVSSRS